MEEAKVTSRGYLIHWDIPGATQFLTWRLYDALDAEQWLAWKAQYAGEADKSNLYRVADQYLDQGMGTALLRNPVASKRVMDALFHRHLETHYVHAAVVMPNHVHAVLELAPTATMAKVMQELKGRSAYEINKALGRTGRLWQPDYFDRVIRDQAHFEKCVNYTHWNPVKANLCVSPEYFGPSTANPVYAERIAQGKHSKGDL